MGVDQLLDGEGELALGLSNFRNGRVCGLDRWMDGVLMSAVPRRSADAVGVE